MSQHHTTYLKWLNKDQKWTQKAIAEELAVTKMSISRYLSGEREIPEDVCNKIEALAKSKKHTFPVGESIYDGCDGTILKRYRTPGEFKLEYYYVFQPSIDMRCYCSRNLMARRARGLNMRHIKAALLAFLFRSHGAFRFGLYHRLYEN